MRPKAVRQKLCVRPFTPSDMPDVLRTETLLPDGGWDRSDVERSIRTKKGGVPNCFCMVAEHLGVTAGHMVYSIQRGHLAVERLVVREDYRRKGVGKALLGHVRDELAHYQVPKAKAWVLDTNDMLVTQMFLRGCGYKARMIEDDFIRFVLTPNQDG